MIYTLVILILGHINRMLKDLFGGFFPREQLISDTEEKP